MTAPLISPAKYLIILGTLIFLTAVTVGISFLQLGSQWHLVLGLSIAVCKASLVALFFMHLIHSQPATRAVVGVTFFWFVIVLVALTFSDYTTRETMPFVPGH